MKCNESLQPFSRDHHYGLVQARRLAAGAAALPAFLRAWDTELSDHIEKEEQLLAGMCPLALREKMLAEHRSLRKMVEAARRGAMCDEDIRRMGVRLHHHIRWEERTLFPELQQTADAEVWEPLSHATDDMELARLRSHLLE